VAAHHPRETGPAALAFAAVVAQHSPLVRAFDKRIIARLFGGMTNFGFTPNTKISVTADSVVCRTSNVDIAARTCDLTFGVRKRTLTGRETNEFSATALRFHLRALPKPYVNLSIHTAPDVRPLP
jgi:hypothetical protein